MFKRFAWVVAAVAAMGVAFPAWASYPDKPVRLIVPFSAGGTVDYVARQLATQLGRQLGGQVVVENVPGAGGSLATARVAKSPADGYTLMFTTPNHTINPALFSNLPFDTLRDLVPVSLVAQIPELLVAHSAQPFNDFGGFVSYAKANPGRLNYSSAGNGTLPHITMELLLLRLGVQVTHIPYKGAAPALNDLLAGQVALKMDTIATASQHIRNGRIKPLAIASLKRSPLMPEVPTIAELGVPGYQGILWMGVLAPTGTDAAIVQQLHKALVSALQQPDLQKQFQADGVEVIGSDPVTFGQLIRTEVAQWADVVQRSKIKAD